MMRRIVNASPCLILVVAFLQSFGIANAIDVDVCVIGAGPSGVMAAYTAEGAGLTTALFEKNNFVGGKTKTVMVDGRVFPMGAVTDNRRLRNGIDDLVKQFNTPILVDFPGDYQFREGETTVEPFVFASSFWEYLSWALYILKRLVFLGKSVYQPDGYLVSGNALFQPTRNFLESRWITAGVTETFWHWMTCLGYGQVKETPMMFLVKYIPIYSLGYAVQLAFGGLIPFVEELPQNRFVVMEKLLQSMVATLRGSVYLSTEITEVSFGEHDTTLTFLVNGGPAQQVSCGTTIVAFAPVPGDIDLFAPPDVGGTLLSLASEINVMNYYSVLLQDTDDFFEQVGTYHITPRDEVPDNPAKILLYLKLYNKVGGPVVGYYLTPSSKTDEQAKQEILAFYSEHIGKNVTESSILAFEPWLNYFPHPLTEALESGFFQKFDDLQGKSRQFYVGGLFNFELVQSSMEHGRFIVEKYIT